MIRTLSIFLVESEQSLIRKTHHSFPPFGRITEHQTKSKGVRQTAHLVKVCHNPNSTATAAPRTRPTRQAHEPTQIAIIMTRLSPSRGPSKTRHGGKDEKRRKWIRIYDATRAHRPPLEYRIPYRIDEIEVALLIAADISLLFS